MKKVALLFSGQGSQYPLMGLDFYQQYPYLIRLYEEASQILGYDLKDIIFKDSPLINETKYTQPAILVTSLAIYEVLKREHNIEATMMAGFSLGEYSALQASGVFSYSDILKLISLRASLMEEASQKRPGLMAAVIGMEPALLSKLCEQVTTEIDFVQIANFNCPNQLVVSGTVKAVESLGSLALEHKARRFIPLNVSGGFHTKLMDEASLGIHALVMVTKGQAPTCPIVMNATADYLAIHELPELMKKQISSAVLFEQSIRRMLADGVDGFIEIGPGKVLSGFVKKIDRQVPVISIDKLVDLDNL